jgi:hypothetical protein
MIAPEQIAALFEPRRSSHGYLSESVKRAAGVIRRLEIPANDRRHSRRRGAGGRITKTNVWLVLVFFLPERRPKHQAVSGTAT